MQCSPIFSKVAACAFQKQQPKLFYKKSILKNFAIFTGKFLHQSLFFNKAAACRVVTIKKRSLSPVLSRTSYRRCSIKKVFLKISQNLQENSCACAATLFKKRLWHRGFPVNFAKFLRPPFQRNTSEWLLLAFLWILKNISEDPPSDCFWMYDNSFPINVF